MEYFIIGLATAFNFTIIIKKLRMGRTADAILDCSMFAAICFLFSGTFGALATGAIASGLISLYLLWNPFTLNELSKPNNKPEKPKTAPKRALRGHRSAYII